MASALIHICVAKELNSFLNKNEKQLFLGSIAPDIAKQVGETKEKSHFLENDVPDLNRFLARYRKDLFDDFILGYYIHLYTDYLWEKYFISELTDEKTLITKDGQKVPYDPTLFSKLVYGDYTNLNIKLLDYYNLDLSLFYEPFPMPKSIIDEIPMDRLQVIIDQMGLIIANSKESKEYVFDIHDIIQFIKTSTELIHGNLSELGICL